MYSKIADEAVRPCRLVRDFAFNKQHDGLRLLLVGIVHVKAQLCLFVSYFLAITLDTPL